MAKYYTSEWFEGNIYSLHRQIEWYTKTSRNSRRVISIILFCHYFVFEFIRSKTYPFIESDFGIYVEKKQTFSIHLYVKPTKRFNVLDDNAGDCFITCFDLNKVVSFSDMMCEYVCAMLCLMMSLLPCLIEWTMNNDIWYNFRS